jgi:hypothetical protein
MRIQDVVGLFAALIGSTATLLTAWSYLRSHRPPKESCFVHCWLSLSSWRAY